MSSCSCLKSARCQDLKDIVQIPTASTCDCTAYKRVCQKLKVVVICTAPWSSPPGTSTISPPASLPNMPPSSALISLGVVRPLQLSGTPTAIQSFDIPLEVTAAFPGGKKSALLYDFGSAALTSGVASAKILARSKGTCTTASLEFIYRWCGQANCLGVVEPRFEVVKNTSYGLRFTVLDDVSYISSNPCLESVVVLGVEQFCPCDGVASDTCDVSSLEYDIRPTPCGTFGPGGSCFSRR